MSMEVRRIALASPGPSRPPRFAVGGQVTAGASGDVKMFEWSRERGEMNMVGLQTDAGQIRAMAWSPSSAHPYLLAVGLASGKTQLLSLSPHTLSLSVSSSRYSPPITLNIKHSRAVTSLDFCPTDSSYLAGGLERHRSDNSLLIWDIHDAISAVPGDKPSHRPADRIEVVNPLALNSRPGDTRPIQQYCQGEHINSVAFLRGGAYTLLASSNNKQIRLWDLRSPAPAPSANSPREATFSQAGAGGGASNWPTRAVYGLTPSNERPERWASWEPSQQGSIVRVWDTRRASEVLAFDVGPNVVGMQWMEGGLGVGTKEGGVGVWDVVNGQLIDQGPVEEWVTLGGMRQIVKPKQNLHSFAYAPTQGGGDVLFVLKDGTIGIGPVPPCPAIATAPSGDLAIGSHSIHLIQQDNLSSAAPRSSQEDSSTPRNPFQLSQNRLSQLLSDAGLAHDGGVNGHDHSHSPRSAGRHLGRHDADDESEETAEESGFKSAFSDDIGGTMRRRAEDGYGLRSLLLNAAIASRSTGSAPLAGVWELVEHLTRLLDSTTTFKSHNLAHAGILSIWSSLGFTSTGAGAAYASSPTSFKSQSTYLNEPTPKGETIRQGSAAWASLKSQTLQSSPSIGASAPGIAGSSAAARRGSQSSAHPSSALAASAGPQLPTPDGEWNTAMTSIYAAWVESGKIPPPGGARLPNSDRTGSRRVVLALCGDGLPADGDLEEEGISRKAAWAYFSNDEEMAIKVLLQSPNPKHRLTGASLAATVSRPARKAGSDFARISEGIDDPYLRAMLRRVAGDPWSSILGTDIPLIDRIVMAVHNLSDRDLNDFFTGLYASLLATPSLEHLVLTGLGPLALPVLARHLEDTGDVQTTALLASWVPTAKLSTTEKATLERWIEAYRDVLDSWKLWGPRSEFDVIRGEIQRILSGEAGTEGNKGGFCPVCNHGLTKQAEELAHRKNALRGTMSWPNERTSTCVYCGNALPRCVICLQLVEARWAGGAEEEVGWDYRVPADTIDTAYVCCQTCRHGGHAYHILPWFSGGLDGEVGHDTCAVKGCECQCGSL